MPKSIVHRQVKSVILWLKIIVFALFEKPIIYCVMILSIVRLPTVARVPDML